MAKKSSERPGKIEVQKGPIEMHAQFTSKFMSESERVMSDVLNNEMRRSGHTMDLHTPKR